MTTARQNLILVGGIFHDFHASAEALATVLAPLGIESRIEADLDAGIASLADNPVDLLTINALRWEMIGEKYDPYRETEAYSPPSETRMAIEAHPDRQAARCSACTPPAFVSRTGPSGGRSWAAAGCGAPVGTRNPRP